MTQNAIEIQNVSKRYRLGEHHGQVGTLRDALTGTGRRLAGRATQRRDEIWALHDVNLEIPEGSALGIIGRNGAGKSTLLKLIARITEPTGGVVRTRGRVGSLLEVGTGFHPELTGRENVYLNGAILGMTKREIDGRYSEIVEFAGVERFLDTPVKRYSSGMYLRLAFAVAAHLDSDILVVDEVLAVGDAEFQRKCLGKMDALGDGGRTVVFVSHNFDAITRLCRMAAWLDGGVLRAYGPSDEVTRAYLAEVLTPTDRVEFADRPGERAALLSARLLDDAGVPVAVHDRSRPFVIEIRFVVRERVPKLDLTAFVDDTRGVRVLHEAWSERGPADRGEAGEYVARVAIPPVLGVGEYGAGFWIGTQFETFQYEPEALRFHLQGEHMGRPDRIVQLGIDWDVERVEATAAAAESAV
jgi:lipopolysaccharide transport system ATP-binding protein